MYVSVKIHFILITFNYSKRFLKKKKKEIRTLEAALVSYKFF